MNKSTSNLFSAVREQQLHFSIIWETRVWNRNKETAGCLNWQTAHICVCTPHLRLIRGPRLVGWMILKSGGFIGYILRCKHCWVVRSRINSWEGWQQSINTFNSTVEVRLTESDSVFMHEAHVELETENNLTVGQMLIFVITNHLKQKFKKKKMFAMIIHDYNLANEWDLLKMWIKFYF